VNLSLHTRIWRNQPLDDALAAARTLGITSLDLNAAPPQPHVDPLAGPAAWEALRPRLDGFTLAAVTADQPDLSRRRDEGGADAIDAGAAALRCATALGAPLVSTALGGTEVDPWDAAWERSANALGLVLQRTARSGIRLAVELGVEDVFDSLKKARRLFVELPDPRLGVTLDLGTLYYQRIELREALDLVGTRLLHVRLSDATRRANQLPIGHGEVSFPAALRTLRERRYRGALALDLGDTEPAGLPRDAALAEIIPRIREWIGEPRGGRPTSAPKREGEVPSTGAPPEPDTVPDTV
jgi:L-ribulose-5-phosphate 3-epimerase